MAAAVEVVELIGVKPKVAVDRKVKGEDGGGRPSIKEHGCKTRLMPAGRGAHAGDDFTRP